MKQVLFAGERLFMKFGSLDYFRRRLEDAGYGLISGEGMSSEEMAGTGASAIVVIAAPVTAPLLRSLQSCEFVMTLSVGYDCVDVGAATEIGIPVSNCPSYCSDDVANHAVALLLSVSRKLHLTASRVRQGNWGYDYAKPIHRYSGRQLGIIGFGKIGRSMVEKAMGLGFETVAYDPYVADDIFERFGVRRSYELDELLEKSDYISIHAPLTEETRHLLDRAAFARMKPDSVVVNTARGPIIDQQALVEALDGNAIGGAGIDVLETEPPMPDEPLLKCEKALVTPHIAWYSEESFEANKILGMDELIRVLDGGRPRYVVNPSIYGA